MNKHELLNLIGEVDENYILAADEAAKRRPIRWQGWAACAACVALVAAVAYPRFLPSKAPVEGVSADNAPVEAPAAPKPESTEAPAGEPGAKAGGAATQPSALHEYILMEGEEPRMMLTQGVEKAPEDGGGAGQPESDAAADMPDDPKEAGAPCTNEAPVNQEEASEQYGRLLEWMGGTDGQEPAVYPEWFAGMWLDNDWPDNTARLTVAIVDGFRTEALEAQIKAWCGGTGDVLFCGAKYSLNELNGLMDGITRAFKELDVQISSTYGVHVMDNVLWLDFFGAVPGDELLAALAELDPDGDAIRIRVFRDRSLQLTDGAPEKDPQPGGAEPSPTPIAEPEPNSAAKPAWYDIQELPEEP